MCKLPSKNGKPSCVEKGHIVGAECFYFIPDKERRELRKESEYGR